MAYIEEKRNACRNLVAINLKERDLLKDLGIGKSFILLDPKDMGSEVVHWVCLPEGRDQWCSKLNMVMFFDSRKI